MYLRIRNKGVAPVEAFTLLGASTARGSEKIGQFGTGAKHGINICLRQGIKFHIFCGEKELKFDARPVIVSGKAFNRVWVDEIPTSWTLEFGELDWQDSGMAAREFICNAIDAVGWENMLVDTCEEVEGSEDSTTILMELDASVMKYFTSISKNFLHVEGKEKETFLEGAQASCLVYRRGVLIGEFKGQTLGRYNFVDVKIDECRNAKREDVLVSIAKHWMSTAERVEWLTTHLTDVHFESTAGYDYHSDDKILKEVWEKLYGSKFCLSGAADQQARDKGYTIVKLPRYLVYAYQSAGVKKSHDVVSKVEANASSIQPGDTELIHRVLMLWNKLKKLELTGDKTFPNVSIFTQAPGPSIILQGYADSNGIYLEKEAQTDITILEEICHYVKGASDYSRGFQEWVLKLAIRLL